MIPLGAPGDASPPTQTRPIGHAQPLTLACGARPLHREQELRSEKNDAGRSEINEPVRYCVASLDSYGANVVPLTIQQHHLPRIRGSQKLCLRCCPNFLPSVYRKDKLAHHLTQQCQGDRPRHRESPHAPQCGPGEELWPHNYVACASKQKMNLGSSEGDGLEGLFDAGMIGDDALDIPSPTLQPVAPLMIPTAEAPGSIPIVSAASARCVVCTAVGRSVVKCTMCSRG